MRNNPFNALALDISATDFSFSASSNSFLDARLPIESITIITLSSLSMFSNWLTKSNLSCSTSVIGVCNTLEVSIPKDSK